MQGRGIRSGRQRAIAPGCISGRLAYAEDFPAEAAGGAVATLARGSRTKHGRAWHLADAIVTGMPEWAGMLGDHAKRPKRR